MRKIKTYQYSNKPALVRAICFLIIGLILFLNPGGIVIFISYILGLTMLTLGIFTLLNFSNTKTSLNIEQRDKLTTGILLIVLGLIACLCASTIETVLRLIIGSWIVYSGILKLINASKCCTDKYSCIPRLTFCILIIMFGLYVILKSNLVFSAIGLFIIILSVIEIISYIMQKKNDIY